MENVITFTFTVVINLKLDSYKKKKLHSSSVEVYVMHMKHNQVLQGLNTIHVMSFVKI